MVVDNGPGKGWEESYKSEEIKVVSHSEAAHERYCLKWRRGGPSCGSAEAPLPNTLWSSLSGLSEQGWQAYGENLGSAVHGGRRLWSAKDQIECEAENWIRGLIGSTGPAETA